MNHIHIKDIKTATIETIHWWNRDESYYHSYFKNLDEICKNHELLKYFTSKIFDRFLKDYSIRRNIQKGYKGVDRFIEEITKENSYFISEVKKGHLNIIDQTSLKLVASKNTSNKQTLSLLSKIAFLINPKIFSLYDTLAKNSLHKILNANEIKVTRKEIASYSGFIKNIQILKEEISKEGGFQHSNELLARVQKSKAYDYFSKNEEAFKLRIVDKLLWLAEQNEKDNRQINHLSYFELAKFSDI